MSVRIAVLGALVLGALAVLIVLLSGRGKNARPSSGKASTPGAVAPSATNGDSSSARPERPMLRGTQHMATGTGPRPTLSLSKTRQRFLAEPRDAAWADPQEQVVRARLQTLLPHHKNIRVPKVSCRTQRCSLLVVSKTSPELQRFLALLQDERGFYRRASQLILHDSRPAKNADDEASVRVVLLYQR